MVSTVSNLTPLGDSKHGGALFTLPREIRDDIYRLLVKGTYLVFFPSGSIYTGIFKLVDKPDLVILRISQAISHEAQEVFYSESVFRYSIDFNSLDPLEIPVQTVKRMKNLKIDIREITQASFGGSYPYQDDEYSHEGRMMAVSKAFFGDFRGTETLRNTLHIRFCSSQPGTTDPLSLYFLPKLRAFHGFRTIIVEISPLRSCKILMQEEQAEGMGSNGYKTAGYYRLIQTVEEEMEATLGPATISTKGFRVFVEFHPREHGPAILRAKAQKLLLDAERLEQGG